MRLLYSGMSWPRYEWDSWAQYMMPNHVRVYLGNDFDAPIEEWKEVGEFFEAQSTLEEERWMYPTYNDKKKYTDLEALELAEPCFFEILFDPADQPYKYMRIEVAETFVYDRGNNPGGPPNPDNRVTMHELEVFCQTQN